MQTVLLKEIEEAFHKYGLSKCVVLQIQDEIILSSYDKEELEIATILVQKVITKHLFSERGAFST